MKNRYLYFTLLSVLGLSPELLAQEEARFMKAPRLVINIAIDQLRSDYLEAFAPLYSSDGFNTLMKEGIVYENASYSFAPIDRASALATIMTGATPYYNNIVGQSWMNRKTLRPVNCVDDTKYPGLLTNEGTSPNKLSTSTIGDELKVSTAGKAVVFAIAPFKDAAILSAGHAANGALWIDDINGMWCSSSYYYKSLPGWVQSYNTLQAPINDLRNTTWEPINELVGNFSYFMQTGLQTPFKHTFSGDRQVQKFKSSSLVNKAVTDIAMQCMLSSGMGTDRVTDMLNLTYYAGTYDNQKVTDCQVELQDAYVRIDHEIGRLISFVTERFGKENVLFVLTSTGYFDEEDADYGKYNIPSGTFYMKRTANLLNMYLGAFWGQGNYVETTFKNQIFLNHELLETKKISITEATERAQEMIAIMSGVRNVYTSLQLLTSKNEQIKKIRNAFCAEHGGDLLIEVAPGWKVLDEDTQQTEFSRESYVQFPIIFYGGEAKAERIKTPVTTERIAPTIARYIHIRAPNACSAEPL